MKQKESPKICKQIILNIIWGVKWPIHYSRYGQLNNFGQMQIVKWTKQERQRKSKANQFKTRLLNKLNVHVATSRPQPTDLVISIPGDPENSRWPYKNGILILYCVFYGPYEI